MGYFVCVACGCELIPGLFNNGPESPCLVCEAEGRKPLLDGSWQLPTPPPPPAKPKRTPKRREPIFTHTLTSACHMGRCDQCAEDEARGLVPIQRKKVVQEPPIPDGFKRCGKCEGVKTLENYTIVRRNKDGLASWCRNCTREYARARYEAIAAKKGEEPRRRGGFQKGDPRIKEWASKGGRTTVERHGPEHFQKAGHIGGASLKKARGREYYRAIGKMGGSSGRGRSRRVGLEVVDAAPSIPAFLPALELNEPRPTAERPAWLEAPMTLTGCAASVGMRESTLLKAVHAGDLPGVELNGIWVTDAHLWAAYKASRGLGRKRKR